MQLGRLIVMLGVGLVAVGLVVMLASKFGVRPFRLPGDIVWKPGGNTTIYIPIVTSILLSLLLTLIVSIFGRR